MKSHETTQKGSETVGTNGAGSRLSRNTHAHDLVSVQWIDYAPHSLALQPC